MGKGLLHKDARDRRGETMSDKTPREIAEYWLNGGCYSMRDAEDFITILSHAYLALAGPADSPVHPLAAKMAKSTLRPPYPIVRPISAADINEFLTREADRLNLTPTPAGESKPVWAPAAPQKVWDRLMSERIVGNVPAGQVICGRCGYLMHPPTCWNCKHGATTSGSIPDTPPVETPLQRAVRIVSER